MSKLESIIQAEATVLQLNPYLNWSTAELHAGIDSRMDQIRQFMAQVEMMVGILALNGYIQPDPGDIA